MVNLVITDMKMRRIDRVVFGTRIVADIGCRSWGGDSPSGDPGLSCAVESLPPAASSYGYRLTVPRSRLSHSPETRPILRLHLLLCRSQKEEENLKNIFVGNLSFGATEDALRTMFEAHGTVDRVNVVTDRENRPGQGLWICRDER